MGGAACALLGALIACGDGGSGPDPEPDTFTFEAVSAGEGHNCGLTRAGRI